MGSGFRAWIQSGFRVVGIRLLQFKHAGGSLRIARNFRMRATLICCYLFNVAVALRRPLLQSNLRLDANLRGFSRRLHIVPELVNHWLRYLYRASAQATPIPGTSQICLRLPSKRQCIIAQQLLSVICECHRCKQESCIFRFRLNIS